MTHAAIVGGSSPGCASTFATCVRSTAIQFRSQSCSLLCTPAFSGDREPYRRAK
jgi:hypothetical protein